jgi:peptidoglycan/xylan/chitin deacetylase (PgdA/CDA1 family)
MAGIALSVVIPARDAAATVGDTLDSLLAQTRTDWQAIVVDDGSTDDTSAIVEAYVRRDKRFRLLSDGRPAEGASAARNRGIASATGRWLLFLDSDDWLEASFVEKMVGAVTRHGRDVVYCSYRHVMQDGRQGSPSIDTRVAIEPFETLARSCPLVIHSVVLERTLVVEVGGFDSSLRVDEDWDLWQRVARTGIAFHAVPDAVAFYRARRNSLSSNVRDRMHDAARVIERGFGPDPRVARPAARHARGAGDGRPKELVTAYLGVWAAAFDIAEKGTGDGLIRPLTDRWEDLLETCQLTIMGGFQRGARILPGDPFEIDAEFQAAMKRLLAEIERAADRPGLAEVLEFALEPDILNPERPRERLVSGQTLFMRQDIRSLQPVEPPPGVDTLNIEFRVDGRYLARTETPLFGILSKREVTEIAIETVSAGPFFKESGVLHRPRFWAHAVASFAALPFYLARARPRQGPKSVFRPRSLVRRALSEAAIASVGRPPGLNQRRALAKIIDEGRALAAATRLPPPIDRAPTGVRLHTATPQSEPSQRLPVLAYHRIADDGPPALARYRTSPAAFSAQIEWLHRQGYRACSSSDVARHLAEGRAFGGRPVLITFDDAYRDFHDTAWPVLRAHEFTAEVFVVTDKVGGTADWDASYGAPAPLMDWREIQLLGAAGVQFGSHMASHSHMETLGSRAMALEAARSRALLERALDCECLSIAAPYGEAVDRFVHIAAQCGYRIGFTVEPGLASLADDPMRLPRIEVQGDWSIESFARAVRGAPGT